MRTKIENYTNVLKKSVSGKLIPRISIISMLMEFYSLLALEAEMKPKPCYYPHDWWLNDFYQYRNWFISEFAIAMRDYLAYAVAGEMRHGDDKAAICSMSPMITRGLSRNSVWEECIKYTPKSIFEAGLVAFNTFVGDWAGAYGGWRWWYIAKAGLMYGNDPDVLFIDHCADLQHNGSSVFNKEAGIFGYSSCDNSLFQFLDLKKTLPPEEVMRYARSRRLQKLIIRAQNLGIIFTGSEFGSESKLPFLGADTELDDTLIMYMDPSSKVVHYEVSDLLVPFSEWLYTDEYNAPKSLDLEDWFQRYVPVQWGTEDMTKAGFKRKRRRSSSCRWKPIDPASLAWSQVPPVSNLGPNDRHSYTIYHPEVKKVVGEYIYDADTYDTDDDM